MKINEVEELLDITRANVRFYEKEGLLTPQRTSNGYRDYSPEDIAQLKTIIIFRKLGFSISDIKGILDGTLPLNNAIKENIKNLQQQIDELNGALNVCEIMEKDETSQATFDAERYWEIIHTQEENGLHFKEFLMDYLEFEKKSFISMWAGPFLYDLKGSVNKYGWKIALGILLIICIVRGLAVEYIWHTGSFLSGFSYPLLLFGFISLISLPLFILNHRYKDVDLSEEESQAKSSKMITLGKVLFVILYIPMLLFGIPLTIETVYFDQILHQENAYIITSNAYIIYFIVGMMQFCTFVFLYSKQGVFPDRFNGEPALKAHLPRKEKTKVTLISLFVFLLSAGLFVTWYDCFTETGVTAKRLFWQKTYDWEDVDYYTLKANFSGTLDYIVVMQDGEHYSCFGNSICFENMDENKYPDGSEDYCLYLTGMFRDMNVPLKVNSWDKLYKNLEYEYWQDYAHEIQGLAQE